jgi:superfamily I DNA and RNA helicase
LSANILSIREIITSRNLLLASDDALFSEYAKKIPPGPQRIRGIAGSGKTRLLCQKAAYMHYTHPDWDIVYTFFSKSLYGEINETIDRFFANLVIDEDRERDPNKLMVLHAWGGNTVPGLLGNIRREHKLPSARIHEQSSEPPYLKLCEYSRETLESTNVTPLFDAILIDEGQDLIIDRLKHQNLLYQGRQPFYYLAYSSCKPINDDPLKRRLIWTYDDYQNIDSTATPTAEEIFGTNIGFKSLLRGKYPGNIEKNIVMNTTYRTPGPIIVASHALCMGFYSEPDGMISGPTSISAWNSIGYRVEGNFKAKLPRVIKLIHPKENSRNPIPNYTTPDEIIQFDILIDKNEEKELIKEKLVDLKNSNGFKYSRDILIVCCIENHLENISYRRYLAQWLIWRGIDVYLPGMPERNILKVKKEDWKNKKSDKFWEKDAITIANVRQAKGNEADYVFVIGLHDLGCDPLSITKRNNLFVAMTRTKGWLHLIGTGDHQIYNEIKSVLNMINKTPNTLMFLYHGKQTRKDNEQNMDELKENNG